MKGVGVDVDVQSNGEDAIVPHQLWLMTLASCQCRLWGQQWCLKELDLCPSSVKLGMSSQFMAPAQTLPLQAFEE